MWEQCLEIARVNRRHNLLPHIAAAVVLCLMAPLLMGVKNLTEPQVAKIAEFYLSFLGVILFVPLFLPDSDSNIRDVVASKKFPITGVRLIRLLQAALFLLVILAVFFILLKYGENEFHFGKCYYAAAANCIGMGGLGLLFYSLIDNIAIAYMMPFLYYLISLGNRKALGKFWLMGFSNGSIDGKKYIAAAGLMMMVAALLIRRASRR